MQGIFKVLSSKFLTLPCNIKINITAKACLGFISLQVIPLNLKEGPEYVLPPIVFDDFLIKPNISTKDIAGGIAVFSTQEPEAAFTS